MPGFRSCLRLSRGHCWRSFRWLHHLSSETCRPAAGPRFVAPMAMIDGTVQRLNASGNAAVLYLHPREMESRGPRLKLSPLNGFAAYGPRTDSIKRLKYLLQRFSFGTLLQLVDRGNLHSHTGVQRREND